MNEEQTSAVIAALDQLGALARTIASTVGGYYRTLLESGMDGEAAVVLASELQSGLMIKLLGVNPRPCGSE